MLKLPVCPHCEARYNYKDVKTIYKNNTEKCHNCKKHFDISYKKGRIILIIVSIFILSIVNVISYNIFVNINIWINLVITIALVSIMTTLFPYTVKFYISKKTKTQKNKTKKINKN